MKYQAIFFLKDKSKKLKCCLLQYLFGTLRLKVNEYTFRKSSAVIFIQQNVLFYE